MAEEHGRGCLRAVCVLRVHTDADKVCTACAETRSDDLAVVVVARDLLGILERKRTFVRGNKGAHASPARHSVALARCREGIRLCKVHRFTRGKIAPVTGNAFHVL